jgi:hypothetical protein
MIRKKCKVCGDVFETLTAVRSTCDNVECRRIGKRPIKESLIPCKICGAPIPAGSHRWVYCSFECQCEGIRRVGRRNVRYAPVEQVVSEAGI